MNSGPGLLYPERNSPAGKRFLMLGTIPTGGMQSILARLPCLDIGGKHGLARGDRPFHNRRCFFHAARPENRRLLLASLAAIGLMR